MSRRLFIALMCWIALSPSARLAGSLPAAATVSVSGKIEDASLLLLFRAHTPVSHALVSVLQDPTIFTYTDRDGSFTLSGVPADSRINLSVEHQGFARTISADLLVGSANVSGYTAYALRQLAVDAAGWTLKLMTGVVLDPTEGITRDPNLGIIGGVLLDARTGEVAIGGSVEAVGSGAVGEVMRQLNEVDKITFTSPTVAYPGPKGAFFISNVPVGEEITLRPKDTHSLVTRPRYQFPPLDVASVKGAVTFVVMTGEEVVTPLHPPGPPESISFTEASHALGIDFTEQTQLPLFNKYLYALGPGVTVNDYDNDGRLDVYVANGEGFPNTLYRNRGDGMFEDVTAHAGVGDMRESGGVAFGDIDNDGCLDLYVGNSTRNTLYRNNCDGTFTDITRSAGVGDTRNARSVTFVDYDNDGFLDIFVSNYDLQRNVDFLRNDNPGQGNVLYHNNGDRTFTDVTEHAGVGHTGLAFAQVFTDYDHDGFQDMFIVHDSGRIVLFHNDGDGTFTDVSKAAGLTATGSWMCASVGDYDNDGWDDLFVTNVGKTTGLFVPILPGKISNTMHALYHNNGDGTFTDVAGRAGVADGGFGWGAEWGDFDNDGNLDLYVVNNYYLMGVGSEGAPSLYGVLPPGGMGGADGFLFMNNGDGTFRDASATTGISDPHDARGATVADYDGDGFLDVFAANERGPLLIFHNSGNQNHWLKVKVRGTQSNRDGIGAVVTIHAGGRRQVRQVSGGSSYKSQQSLEVEFGLGSTAVVDSVEVRFPSGRTATRDRVAADQLVKITEPRRP